LSLLVLFIVFLVIGFFTGILIGMLGIGGGLVFVPALYYLLPTLDIPQSNLAYFTIGTSLFAGALATSNSAVLHIRNKNYSKRPAILVAAGAVITAFFAPFFVVKVKSEIIEFIFASVMFLIALRMIFENSKNEKYKLSKPLRDPFLFLVGLFTGVLSAFTGLGGGVVYVPTLIYLFLINAKVAVGTSSIITAFTMISSAISYSLQGTGTTVQSSAFGFVVPEAAVPLGIGAVIGSFLGVRIVMKSSTELVKKAFAILLIAAVTKILLT
jgi:uncharacterized membrane protein YfcA